jgi:hypothetical protein
VGDRQSLTKLEGGVVEPSVGWLGRDGRQGAGRLPSASVSAVPDGEPKALALDYLYVDSSEADTRNANVQHALPPGDQMWRTLGDSVQLAPGQIVHLQQGAFRQVIDGVENYPTLKRWIGDTKVWSDIWAGAPNGIEAGGQLRRFGRYLFAQNVQRFEAAFLDRINARQSGGAVESRWTIHVVAGLAGGTGSGTLVDVVGQIRKLRPNRDETKIILYAVLPETDPTSWAKANYYANGYAALSEINGLLVKAYAPSDVASAVGRYESELPINNVFLITNRNENGLLVDMNTVTPDVVAETLFQLVVASGDARALNARDSHQGAGGADRIWRDMVTGENNQGEYERDAQGAPFARANRFISFGIKRVAIPHQEIREFASLAFLRQAALQLWTNNWQEGAGYSETPKRFDAAALVRSDAVRERWQITDGHLMLERKSLDNDNQAWKPLQNEFLDPLNAKEQRIKTEVKSNDQWIQPLETFGVERFGSTFRNVGAAEFYRVAERSIVERARHVADRIGADLFDRWTAGELAAADISRALDEAVQDIQDRLTAAEKRIANESRIEKEKDEARKASLSDYSTKGGGGLIRGLTYSRPLGLTRHAGILAEYYEARTRQIALGFQRKLLTAILREVQTLGEQVSTVADRLQRAVEIVETRSANRVPANEAGDSRAHFYKLYDQNHVRSVVRRLESDEALQKRQTADLRASLVAELGPRPTFGAFVERLSEWRLIERLERQAELQAEEALGAVEAVRDRILESSIIQKLYEEYGGREEELRRFLSERVREAGSFAQFAPEERIKDSTVPTESCLVAFVPAADELHESLRPFRDQVANVIRSASNAKATAIVETRDRGQEITLLSMVSLFPLRHLAALKYPARPLRRADHRAGRRAQAPGAAHRGQRVRVAAALCADLSRRSGGGPCRCGCWPRPAACSRSGRIRKRARPR